MNSCEPRSFRVLQSEEAFGFRTTWIGLPDVVCADGVRIQADSAVLYDAGARSEFMGSFRYRDADRELTADAADYFELEGRLFARGQVRVVASDGTEVRGDTLTLYELAPGPDDDQIRVSGSRAFARLLPDEPEPGAEAPAPFEVEGLQLRFEGERLFLADGDVEVTRDSLQATAQSLSFVRDAGTLTLTGGARVESPEAVFLGDVVDLALPEEELRSITLRGGGSLVSEDLEVRGDEIRIDVVNGGEIEHLVAVDRADALAPGVAPGGPQVFPDLPARGLDGNPIAPPDAAAPPGADPAAVIGGPPAAGAAPGAAPALPPSRPVGIARGFEIVADSLDVLAPGGALQTLRAVGKARGVSRPESEDGAPQAEDVTDPDVEAALASHGIDPSVLENDWIEGDTIVATFAPGVAAVPSGGSGETRDYVLERLVAIGNGRSIYRYPPESFAPDGTPLPRPDRSRWTINYVVANRITLILSGGRVDSAEAEGQVVGGYLDPLPEATAGDDASGDDPAVDPDAPGGAP
jgi:lipopolysaccharide export system protein LptA